MLNYLFFDLLDRLIKLVPLKIETHHFVTIMLFAVVSKV